MIVSEPSTPTMLDQPHPGSASARSFGRDRALRQGGKVLPEHARGHNRSLVLQTLFHQGAMSRADLSRETGLTRVTISDLVAELITDGFVAEMGMREASGPGKPAKLVDLDRAGHLIFGPGLSRQSMLARADQQIRFAAWRATEAIKREEPAKYAAIERELRIIAACS